METDDATRSVDGCLTFLIGCAISFCIGAFVGVNYERHNTSTPVERNNVIDSLTAVNDTIKIKVEKLDSIKDAKVIEVSTLDNDSTLKLFHELVSE
jgi:hypothetical protein